MSKTRQMKIIFFGTSEFAQEPLRGLIESEHKILAVVTQPDRPSGRGRRLLWPPVKRLAREPGLLVKQPEDPNSPGFLREIEQLDPDIIVVVAYAHKLGPKLLEIPPHGCINIHPSLLPLYRGAAPINWAIIQGEMRTGVTVMRMNERFDAGEILMQEAVDIGPDETAGELSDRLSSLGKELLLRTIAAIKNNEAVPRSQDEGKATRAPRIHKEDCELDWSRGAVDICNLIRGLYPKPGAFSYFRGRVIKLSRADTSGESTIGEPGQIVDIADGIRVATGEGLISVLRLQPEGKREMSWRDFRNGFRPEINEKFGSKQAGSA